MLSVVVPVYNGAQFLASCLDSLVGIRVEEYELIVVDDGSTDLSLAIAVEYSRRFPVIKVLQHPGGCNLGVSASRNLGLSRASGDFVGFLDADDLVSPSRFTWALSVLRQNPGVDGVFEAVGVVFDGPLATEAWGASPLTFFPKPVDGLYGVVRAVCSGDIKAFTQSLTIRREILAQSGGFDVSRKMSEDYHFILRLVLSGVFVCADTTEPMVHYRRHASNTWNPGARDSFRDLCVLADVLRWGEKRTGVDSGALAVVRDSFKSKLRHCFDLLAKRTDRHRALKVVFEALRTLPALGADPNFWSNAIRTTLRGARSSAGEY